MRTALLIGHLDHHLTPPLGHHDPELLEQFDTVDALGLERVARGLQASSRSWSVELIPFGPGPVFTGHYPGAISLPTSGGASVELPVEQNVVIEMGHDEGHDWGSRLSEVNSEKCLRNQDVLVAYSTPRPLFGPGGTSNTSRSLHLREDSAEPPGWRPHLDSLERSGRRHVALSGADSERTAAYHRPGSGAGGGAAAWLAALGARLHPAEEVLAAKLGLQSKIQDSDLVIVATPFWNSPDLAEALPLHAATIASGAGIPVVGVGFCASLSAHEQSQWGLHGLHLARKGRTLERLGERVGQTWMR